MRASIQCHVASVWRQVRSKATVCGDWLYLNAAPPHFVAGDIRVCRSGRGRGLEAGEAGLRPGELVLAVQPLALLLGPQDEVPPAELLLPQLRSLLPSQASCAVGQQQWVHQGQQHLQTQPVQQQHLYQHLHQQQHQQQGPHQQQQEQQQQQQQQGQQALDEQQQGEAHSLGSIARQWLQLLYAGDNCSGTHVRQPDPDSSSASPAVQGQGEMAELVQLQRLLHCPLPRPPPPVSPSTGPRTKGRGSETDSTGIVSAPGAGEADTDLYKRLDWVVALNAFGDAYEDLALARLRQSHVTNTPQSSDHSTLTSHERPTAANGCTRYESDSREREDDASSMSSVTSHVGLWPHFALLNHACDCNCVHYVTGSCMVVRAVRDVASGEELTVSYLGREEFSPASIRQQVLEERFGFRCSCPRCLLEAQLPPSLSSLLEDIHRACSSTLTQRFTQAAEEGDEAALEEVGSVLVAWSHRLHSALHDFMQHLTASQSGSQATSQATSQPDEATARQQSADHSSSSSSSSSSSTDCNPGTQCVTLGGGVGEPGGEGGGQRLAEVVAGVGGPGPALLRLYASVYSFLELLQQHAQLKAYWEQGGGEGQALEEEGEEEGGGGQGRAKGTSPGAVVYITGGERRGGGGGGGKEEARLSSIASLQLCADVVHEVSRGSELDVFLSTRLVELASQSEGSLQSPDPDAVAVAGDACEEALLARYGPVSPQMKVRLAQLNAQCAADYIL